MNLCLRSALILTFIFFNTIIFSKPLTFVTYHATSQYYPNISASEIAAIVPYGGKLKLKIEPEADSTHAKKKLLADNLLSEGDVQFGGTEETKGSLELKNVSGTAKSLETVDAHIEDLYLYNIQFPAPGQAMTWKTLSVKTLGNGTYSATFLTLNSASGLECKIVEQKQCVNSACPNNTEDTYDFDKTKSNLYDLSVGSKVTILTAQSGSVYHDFSIDDVEFDVAAENKPYIGGADYGSNYTGTIEAYVQSQYIPFHNNLDKNPNCLNMMNEDYAASQNYLNVCYVPQHKIESGCVGINAALKDCFNDCPYPDGTSSYDAQYMPIGLQQNACAATYFITVDEKWRGIRTISPVCNYYMAHKIGSYGYPDVHMQILHCTPKNVTYNYNKIECN